MLISLACAGNLLKSLAAQRTSHGIGLEWKAKLLIPVLLLFREENEASSAVAAGLVNIVVVRDRHCSRCLPGKIGCNRRPSNHPSAVVWKGKTPTE